MAQGWCHRAVDQGYAPAQYNLGVIHDEGHGVDQDFAEALRWYRLAADQGYAKAQFNLGWMYGLGKGVPPDNIQSHFWLSLAAGTVDKVVLERASELVAELSKQMTSAELAESRRLASQWKAE